MSIRNSPTSSIFCAKWKEDAKQVAGSLGRVTVTFPTYIHI